MIKHLYKLIAVVAIVGLTFSCSSPKRTDKSGKTTDSVETAEIDSSYEDRSSLHEYIVRWTKMQKKLLDILFGASGLMKGKMTFQGSRYSKR